MGVVQENYQKKVLASWSREPHGIFKQELHGVHRLSILCEMRGRDDKHIEEWEKLNRLLSFGAGVRAILAGEDAHKGRVWNQWDLWQHHAPKDVEFPHNASSWLLVLNPEKAISTCRRQRVTVQNSPQKSRKKNNVFKVDKEMWYRVIITDFRKFHLWCVKGAHRKQVCRVKNHQTWQVCLCCLPASCLNP